MQGYNRLAKLLRKTKAALVIGHQNSDPDAVCSAYAFVALAKRINRRIKITFTSPDGVSKLSKQILTTVPLEVADQPVLSSVDLLITVDTNTLQQLGELREPIIQSGIPIVMIDHHAPHSESAESALFVLCDEKATSTCEMLLAMYEELHMPLKREVAQILLTGMLVETGHLSIATRRTFESAYKLVRLGADPDEAMALTRSSMDESERIARIKSAQRVRLERVGKWIVALSEVGSYHAFAARALIALGAHLAIVAGKRNDELTVSFRATRDFCAETKMHLGTDLANPLGSKMNGMGGGHPTAAGANVKGEVNESLRNSLAIVRQFLTRPPKPNTTTPSYAETPSQNSVITQE